MSDNLFSDIRGLIEMSREDILNENANKDSGIISTQRDLLAGIVSKFYAKKFILPKAIVDAHESGDIHYHDLDYAPMLPMFNCMLVDIGGMLRDGFRLGNANISSPNSIITAGAIIPQIVASVSSHNYGGTTINRIDEVLAPYAEKSYKKHIKDGERFNIPDVDLYAREMTLRDISDATQELEYELNTLSSTNGQTPFITFGFGLGTGWFEREIQKAILNTRIAGLGPNHETAVFPKLIFTLKDGLNLKPSDLNYDIKLLAVECASKRIYPDILSYDKVVEVTGDFKAPMGCVDGDETITYKENGVICCKSFSDFWDEHVHLGVDTHGVSEYIKTEGLAIFDIDGTFTKVEGIIKNPDKGDWRLVKFTNGRSLLCTGDHPLPVNGKGRVFVDDMCVGDRVNGHTSYSDAMGSHHKDPIECECMVSEIVNLGYTGRPSFDVTTESDTFVVSGLASHNCRSFLGHYEEDGVSVIEGRNNLGVVSVNLPRIGIEARQFVDARGGDVVDVFFAMLGDRLEIAHDAMLTRIDRLRGVKASVAPILYTEGAVGVRLKPDDEIMPLFENGRASISLGYIGIHECINALFGSGEHTFNSEYRQSVGLSIVEHLSNACERWKNDEGWGYSLYSTPSENLCDRFCRLDTEKYGVIEGVTDKGYYTNSFHLDVEYNTDPYSKIKFERGYPKLASGGFINYVEMPSLIHNPKAIEDIWDYAYKNVPYCGVNMPVDVCYECGYHGEFDCTNKGFSCPSCGNRNPKTINVIRRVCGYLGVVNARPFNAGKQEEVSRRVKHTD